MPQTAFISLGWGPGHRKSLPIIPQRPVYLTRARYSYPIPSPEILFFIFIPPHPRVIYVPSFAKLRHSSQKRDKARACGEFDGFVLFCLFIRSALRGKEKEKKKVNTVPPIRPEKPGGWRMMARNAFRAPPLWEGNKRGRFLRRPETGGFWGWDWGNGWGFGLRKLGKGNEGGEWNGVFHFFPA